MELYNILPDFKYPTKDAIHNDYIKHNEKGKEVIYRENPEFDIKICTSSYQEIRKNNTDYTIPEKE